MIGRILRLSGVVAACSALCLIDGCGGSKTATPVPPVASKAAELKAPAEAQARKQPVDPVAAPFGVRPVAAKLEVGDSGLQFLAEGKGPHGGRLDRTAEVAWTSEPEGVVRIGSDGYVQPLKPGKTKVGAVLGGHRVTADVEVSPGDASGRPWDFAADIVPILTRQGCNTGGCHGKADGQNGFHLSLFGYDPEGDYQALTRDANGRRLLLLQPEESLLLRKATGRTPHDGGQRIVPDSDAYRVLRDWIAAQAPERRGKVHGAVAKIHVEPPDVRLEAPGPAQMRVVAEYADGHRRDVTRLAQFKVNDDSAAEVSAEGKARLLRRAETDLIIRFGSQVVSTRISTIINPDLKYDFAALPKRNLVDVELFKRLESLKVPLSPRSSDAAFLRRVSLDLTGEQPDASQIKEFLKDQDPDKRAKKVDELIKRDDFVAFWQIKLGDMLQISQARFNTGAGPYQSWLGRRLRENAPWDKMVRELLTALGDPADLREGGPVNYALDGMDPKVAAEQTAQRFLGLRLRCAQCHDHPFDVWTQDDYFGLAAIFARVSRGTPGAVGAMMARPKVTIDPNGKVEHLRTRKPAEMRLLNHQVVKVEGKDDPRKALANWMTGPDNPYFARATANWVWAQFYGRGIAEPADDLSRANPPVHPELLDALAKHFVEHKYDLRDLIRTIATSEAYGVASSTVPGNEHDTRLFSHHLPRPLTAHQMADALAQVTGVPLRFGQAGQRGVIRKAIEINDPSIPSTLLDTFGRCPRTNGCSAVSVPALSLRQSLLLIGGNEVDGKVSNLNGYLSNLLLDNPDPSDLVELLYFKTLCRPPTPEELSHWTAELKGASSFRDAAEDLFWALLNSREFAFNH
ncbi:MAG: Protein of unknown function (DUF1553)/Protein of unknown function [Planctomycetota bacterium]|nr:Protein of unknown function (DUF1553)/Protein of unknown function [Planctomycetota bacterium]